MKRYSATYKIVTALLTLYYLLSLCGFNVHHDTVCGRSYLTLLYLGTDCSDIHPDSSCCQHSGTCTHSACSQHSEVCTHSNCGKHSGDCGNSKGCEIAGAFNGHCNHCFNESGIADDTADLRSGRIRDGEPAAYIGTNVEYAPYQELGTIHMKAQPFLKPAVADHANEYRKIIENELKNG